MSLLDFFKSLQYSSLLSAMRDSPWIFPIIASVHLMGLALIGGAVLLVDLRLLGLGMRNQPLPQLARDAERWLVLSLVILLPTGILQFMCFAATKYYYLRAFWVKMAALFLALVFTFSVRRKVLIDGETRMTPLRNKLVAAVSLALWATVAIAGRIIGLP
ncbi:MAG: hypothetical protein DMG15_00850 [Acidobacteria bacterium]|nr:MAG: hypothetical protein DMG16_00135 [Acidobacteriota bacterium]PYS16893.1 MAG: hypothetical protein DMG15_00850 [Acidobacteriota bacterium]